MRVTISPVNVTDVLVRFSRWSRRRCLYERRTVDLTQPDRDRPVAVVPNPTQLAAYRWLLRYLFADGDSTPPPPPPSSLDSRAASLSLSARRGAPDATP